MWEKFIVGGGGFGQVTVNTTFFPRLMHETKIILMTQTKPVDREWPKLFLQGLIETCWCPLFSELPGCKPSFAAQKIVLPPRKF